MLSVGQLIWVSVRPLLRLMICVGSGFAITKADIFPAAAARGAGQIVLNIALPSLMFSRIVPAFNSDNIHALGPLVLVAVTYAALGILIAFVVRRFFWVPHRFRYGILVAGGWGNTGDIPPSVLMSICGSAPFNGTADQNLSVAYSSVFILVFMITMFPMGGHTLVAKDFIGPEVENEKVRENTRKNREALILGWVKLFRGFRILMPHRLAGAVDSDLRGKPCPDHCKANSPQSEHSIQSNQAPLVNPIPDQSDLPHPDSSPGKYVSFRLDDGISSVVGTEAMDSQVYSPISTELVAFKGTSAPTVTPAESTLRNIEANSSNLPKPSHSAPVSSQPSAGMRRIWGSVAPIIHSLLSPASFSITLSLLIALIAPLRALFVPVANSPIPNGPDGLPPLQFLLDTATFMGGASVPLGSICLGSALARLRVPRSQWASLPLGAISGLAIGKMIVVPILGVLICQGLAKAGIIDEHDKVLRLVCILMSCIPTGTTQVFLTQVYSGTGIAEHLPAFLIPQYIIMFFSMTILILFTLHLLFK